jgi:hypothetical protein
LTGSANLLLLQSVSQSLAGRAAFLNLLPLGLEEIRKSERPVDDLWTTVWRGGYPALFDRPVEPSDWLSAYVTAYVERDVRQISNVTDLVAFQTFVRLAAGRSGQLVQLSSLGADAGVSHNTAKAWLSVLETSYLAFRLPAYHANLGKRLVKTPKLHFHDSGLLCFLLGIRSPDQLANHPLRGAIFETWVVSEIWKGRMHRGLPPALSYFRDRHGLELDAILESGARLSAIEVKSGRTLASDFLRPLHAFGELMQKKARPRRRVSSVLVYGGDEGGQRSGAAIVPWHRIDRGPWTRA